MYVSFHSFPRHGVLSIDTPCQHFQRIAIFCNAKATACQDKHFGTPTPNERPLFGLRRLPAQCSSDTGAGFSYPCRKMPILYLIFDVVDRTAPQKCQLLSFVYGALIQGFVAPHVNIIFTEHHRARVRHTLQGTFSPRAFSVSSAVVDGKMLCNARVRVSFLSSGDATAQSGPFLTGKSARPIFFFGFLFGHFSIHFSVYLWVPQHSLWAFPVR